MLLSKSIVRLNTKCYLGITSTRQFSVDRNAGQRSEQRLLRSSYHVNSSLRFLSVSLPRLNETAIKEELIFQVPEPPAAPAAAPGAPDVSQVFTIPEKPSPVDLSVLGEPSLDSLGLASYWPPGRLQYVLELLHINLGLEWYQAIAIATLMLRLIMFPVVVHSQRNMAHMNNNMPKMSALQEKISDARKRGDMYEMAQLTQELQVFTSKKGINPIKNALPMFAQFPVFMSFFFGLRGMANCPVESMSTGGALWFDNLTIADPFCLLPLITSVTLFIQFKTGAEGAKLDTAGPLMKGFMYMTPLIIFPMTFNFPCALTFYWACSNLISLTQARLLKIPKIRSLLKIPVMVKHKKPAVKGPGKQKGFVDTVRDTLDNFRAAGKVLDRREYDEKMFREAGNASPPKTYSYDPTKPVAFKKTKF